MVDRLNALGWNAGIRTPSQSLDPNAWRRLTPSTARSTIVRQLIKNYQSDDEIREHSSHIDSEVVSMVLGGTLSVVLSDCVTMCMHRFYQLASPHPRIDV
jgi:hypothetical protein